MTKGDMEIKALEEDKTQVEFNLIQLNDKTRYTLICTLSKDEYKKLYRLKSTKEIWDSLNINYEENIKDHSNPNSKVKQREDKSMANS